PYRRQKEADPPFSVKPKSGRFGYRDWVAVTVGARDGLLASPAASVSAARRIHPGALRGSGVAEARLRVGGWAMNNMEALAYLHADQPLHLAAPERVRMLDDMAIDAAEAADVVAGLLRHSL